MCQGSQARAWLEAPYFHVVFTLPPRIGAVAFQNKAVIYDLLFKASAETLAAFGRGPSVRVEGLVMGPHPKPVTEAEGRQWWLERPEPFRHPPCRNVELIGSRKKPGRVRDGCFCRSACWTRCQGGNRSASATLAPLAFSAA
jgi:hypothetical protein